VPRHSVTELLEALGTSVAGVDTALLDRARALDKLYVPTRYPNWLPAGAPADLYTAAEAQRAIADAEAIVPFCQRLLLR
jgi:HEPN domain-containing protein